MSVISLISDMKRSFYEATGSDLRQIVVSEAVFDALAGECADRSVSVDVGLEHYVGIHVDGVLVRWAP